jgi:hypothetical protein
MRAGRFASAIIVALSVLGGACGAPKVAPKPVPVPLVFATLTVQVEPKQATVRIGSRESATDAEGVVTRSLPIGALYYVSATAEGYTPSRAVRVLIEKDTPPIYFVLRRVR